MAIVAIEKTGTTQKRQELEKKLSDLRKLLDSVEGTPTEVYSRIVGYYRSVRNWNAGKRHEYTKRKMYSVSAMETAEAAASGSTVVKSAAPGSAVESFSAPLSAVESFSAPRNAVPELNFSRPNRYLLFVKPGCPNCPSVKNYLSNVNLTAEIIDVSTEQGFSLAERHQVLSTPTVIFYADDNREAGRAFSRKDAESYIVNLV